MWVAFLAGTLHDRVALSPHVAGVRRMHRLLDRAGIPVVEAKLLTAVVDGLILDACQVVVSSAR